MRSLRSHVLNAISAASSMQYRRTLHFEHACNILTVKLKYFSQRTSLNKKCYFWSKKELPCTRFGFVREHFFTNEKYMDFAVRIWQVPHFALTPSECIAWVFMFWRFLSSCGLVTQTRTVPCRAVPALALALVAVRITRPKFVLLQFASVRCELTDMHSWLFRIFVAFDKSDGVIGCSFFLWSETRVEYFLKLRRVW